MGMLVKMVTSLLLVAILTSVSHSQEDVSVSEIQQTIDDTLKHIEKIKTYEFLLIKRELVDGEDTGYHYMGVRLRTDPLSVYLMYFKPERYEGREALYMSEPFENLVVRRGGRSSSSMVLHLKPDSPLALDGNRYPITHINPSTTCKELAKTINHEIKFKDTIIRKKGGASLYGHKGTHYRLTHLTQEPGQECKTAEMLLSDTLHIPYYYKVVSWRDKTLEEYAFRDMLINPTFGPQEFTEDNPQYGFTKDEN